MHRYERRGLERKRKGNRHGRDLWRRTESATSLRPASAGAKGESAVKRICGGALLAALAGLTLSVALRGGPCLGHGKKAPGAAASGPGEGRVRTSLAGETTREVAALWFSGGLGAAKGGHSDVTIEVEDSDSETARVSFGETEAGGSGATWRAAGWMAACVASLETGRPLNTYEVAYTCEGAIDGPSAGCLFTVAVLSALTGVELDDQVTMTGTINPDGTVGPVGGIPHKLEGAKEAGRTKVLVPLGQRYDFDLSGSEPKRVDLLAVGEDMGIEVIEVATVADAYREFTGQDLGGAEAGSEAPSPPGESYDRVAEAASRWMDRAAEYQASLESLDPAIIRALVSDGTLDLDGIQATYDRATDYLSDGLSAAAYDAAFQAALQLAMGYSAGRIQAEWQERGGDLDALVTITESESARRAKVDEFFDELAEYDAKTVSDVIALSDAYSTAMMSVGLLSYAADFVAVLNSVESAEEAVPLLTATAMVYSVIEVALEFARDRVEIGYGLGGAEVADRAALDSWAETTLKAAEANLHYFDTSVLGEVAAQAGMHPDAVKQRFILNEEDYRQAVCAIRALNSLTEYAGKDTEQASLATLGAASLAFALTSGLVAEYYSLDTRYNADTGETSVGKTKPLITMLDEADKRARVALNEADDSGVDITLPYSYYEAGRLYRESGGDVDTKLEALYLFWTSSTYARVMSLLASG